MRALKREKKWADYFLKTSLPRLVRISFQFQEPTEMIKKFLTTQKFSLLTVCTLPWQDKINRLDGTAASAVCCIMHKKHKKENEKYLLNEILQLSVTKKLSKNCCPPQIIVSQAEMRNSNSTIAPSKCFISRQKV